MGNCAIIYLKPKKNHLKVFIPEVFFLGYIFIQSQLALFLRYLQFQAYKPHGLKHFPDNIP